MFQRLLEENTGEENDAAQQYLLKANSDAEKDLENFKRKQDREKKKICDDLEAEKKKKIDDMMGRQDRMFNWEDKIRK